MTRIAFLMPTLNAQTYLVEAIVSLQRQSHTAFDLFVLDGGSTDATVDICRALQKQDRRITILSTPATSPLRRINDALDNLPHDYLLMAHADDVSVRERAARQLAFMQQHPELILSGSNTHFWLHEKSEALDINHYSGFKTYPAEHAEICCQLPFWWSFSIPSLILNGAAVRQESLRFDASLKVSSDWWFYWQAARAGRVANLQEPLISYRHHAESDGTSQRPLLAREARLIRERIARDAGFWPLLTPAEAEAFLAMDVESNRISAIGGRKATEALLACLGEWKAESAGFAADAWQCLIADYDEQIKRIASSASVPCIEPDISSEPSSGFDPTRLQDQTPVSDPDRFPPGRSPYYIVTPRYIRTSAGIKALHLLCHCLNRVGQEAFLVIYPAWVNANVTSPRLLTPLLTPAVIDRHKAQGVSPVVVYPETVLGNPLGARSVVRYLLNFPGLLGGPKKYSARDMVFGYSKILAEAGGAPERVLFIPASDAAIFTPPAEGSERRGSCFSAMKYRLEHGGEPGPVTADSVEITREQPDSPDPATIAELFRRSEVFYTYENTALALEAALCLCPTVFLPNPWLTDVIAVKEMGWDGFAWGTDPAEVARAKATVHLARARFLSTYVQFWDQLSAFVATTQNQAAKDTARSGFPGRLAWRLHWKPRIALATSLARNSFTVLRHEGPVAVWRKTRYWLVRAARALLRR